MTKKFFADEDSDGESLSNLQLTFWRVAVRQFELIRSAYSGLDDDGLDKNGTWDRQRFIEEAAVCVVLAGTSVAALVGRHASLDPNKPKQVKAPRAGLEDLDIQIIPAVEDFLDFYNGLRHFGEPKEEIVKKLDEERLETLMTTAQDLWKKILSPRPEPREEFEHSFSFD